MFSESSVHGHLVLVLMSHDEAKHYGREHIVEQSNLLHDGREAERVTGREQGVSFQCMPPVTPFLQLYPVFHSSTASP
jgi:hypothetical protein